MGFPKLRIKPKKYTEESMIVILRIPKYLCMRLDHVVAETGRTRSEVIETCLDFALENIEIEPNDKARR